MLWGCPIYMVGKYLPADEVPYWLELYENQPWGFRGLDRVMSKTALQVCSSNSKLKPNTSVMDFMWPDSYRDGHLSDDEFAGLSYQERESYIESATLTDQQFSLLEPELQIRYEKRIIQNAKNII